MEHIPVMLEEAVDALAVKEDGIYLDGTFGRGGHSALILSKLGESGRLYAIDQDMAMTHQLTGLGTRRAKT